MPITVKSTSLHSMLWLLNVVGSALCFSRWIFGAFQAWGNGSGADNPRAETAGAYFFLSLIAHFVLSIALAGRSVKNGKAKGSPGKSVGMLSAGLILSGLALMLAISMLVFFFWRVSVQQ